MSRCHYSSPAPAEIAAGLREAAGGPLATETEVERTADWHAFHTSDALAAAEKCPRGLRAELPPVPQRMASLPLDSRGFPVPWFVEWIDGVPDFRVMDAEKFVRAIRHKLCWCCGQPLGRNMAFVAGPMCGINRTSAEPPSHLDCALFSAQGCPFLTRPKMRRNEKDLPAGQMAGFGIMRNPGVAMVYITRSYKPFQAGQGILIEMGDPEEVRWFAQGRPATRAEVQESIDTGLHHLESMAAEEEGGLEHLEFCKARFMPCLPAA